MWFVKWVVVGFSPEMSVVVVDGGDGLETHRQQGMGEGVENERDEGVDKSPANGIAGERRVR